MRARQVAGHGPDRHPRPGWHLRGLRRPPHLDRIAGWGFAELAPTGEAIAAAGLTVSNEVCPGAAHGYTMADTAMWDEAGAERHYVELDGLFARTL